MSKLVKVQDKLTVPVADHNLELKSLWAADVTRPWEVYSSESCRQNWDIKVTEPRSK